MFLVYFISKRCRLQNKIKIKDLSQH